MDAVLPLLVPRSPLGTATVERDAIPASVWRAGQVLDALAAGAGQSPPAASTGALRVSLSDTLGALQQSPFPVPSTVIDTLLRTAHRDTPLAAAMLRLVQAVLPQQTAETLPLLEQFIHEAIPTTDRSALQLPMAQSTAPTRLPLAGATQLLQQATVVIRAQAALPATTQVATDDLLRWMTQSARNAPALLERELFALPVLQQHGLTLDEYISAAAHADPTRTALLLIAGQGDGELVADLRAALEDPTQFDAMLTRWTARLSPTTLPNVTGSADELLRAVAAWNLPGSAERSAAAGFVPLVALSRTEGVLPPSAWQAQMQQFATQVLEWQGAAWVAAHAPASAKTRATVRTRGGDAAWISVLSFWLHDANPIEPADASPEQQQRAAGVAQYAHASAPAVNDDTLLGGFDFSLATPVILTHTPQEQSIAAPLHVSFRFLADLVDPATRYDRQAYLRVPQSSAAARFRETIAVLSERGLNGFSHYADALTALLDTFPLAAASRASIEQYLRDAVLWHVTGRHDGAAQQMTTLDRIGADDIVASICATTGALAAQHAQYGDALIYCTDAARINVDRPELLGPLARVLQHLRTSTGSRTTHLELPLPVNPRDCTADAPALALAAQFAQHVAVV